MAKQFSRTDFLQIGEQMLRQGSSLDKIKAKLLEMGAGENEVQEAMEELKKLKAQRDAETKQLEEKKAASGKDTGTGTPPQKKSLSWLWIILFLLILTVIGLLYFSGMINADILS